MFGTCILSAAVSLFQISYSYKIDISCFCFCFLLLFHFSCFYARGILCEIHTSCMGSVLLAIYSRLSLLLWFVAMSSPHLGTALGPLFIYDKMVLYFRRIKSKITNYNTTPPPQYNHPLHSITTPTHLHHSARHTPMQNVSASTKLVSTTTHPSSWADSIAVLCCALWYCVVLCGTVLYRVLVCFIFLCYAVLCLFVLLSCRCIVL